MDEYLKETNLSDSQINIHFSNSEEQVKTSAYELSMKHVRRNEALKEKMSKIHQNNDMNKLDMNYIMSCYQEVRDQLTIYEVDHANLDLNIENWIHSLNSDQPFEENNSIKWLTTYCQMYGSMLQAIIEFLKLDKNPFFNSLLKIKAGYNKLMNTYNAKISEINYKIDALTPKAEIKNLNAFVGDRKSTISTMHDNLEKFGSNIEKSKNSDGKSPKKVVKKGSRSKHTHSVKPSRRDEKSLETYISPRCLNLDISNSSIGCKSSDDLHNTASKRKSVPQHLSKSPRAKPKLIPLNNLKKIIEEIYVSKREFDKTFETDAQSNLHFTLKHKL